MVNFVEWCLTLVSYVDKGSIRFVNALSRLCLKQFDVRLISLYCTSNVGQHFQIHTATPLSLYGFDHRVREHLNLADSRKSGIKDYNCHAPPAIIYDMSLILLPF